MTTIYFVRHAEADNDSYKQPAEKSTNEDKPLSNKGQNHCALVTKFLKDKEIDVVLSSPYKRAVDTISGFAKVIGAEIELVADFREREKGKGVKFTPGFTEKQWSDFSYKQSNGESLAEVQKRNIAALQKVLEQYKGKNLVIGTHGEALGTIINNFDKSFGFAQKNRILNPFVVKMIFDEKVFIEYEMIDLFHG